MTDETHARINDALRALTVRGFAAQDEALTADDDASVSPSVPILWFGDVGAYFASPVRVVTVGLNPSRAEFPSADPFTRFRSVEGLRGIRTAADFSAYRQSMSSYFSDAADPYRSWFASFEPLLNGMEASFYGGHANTALHTDMCSPIATDPTWSRLPSQTRRHLLRRGRPLWHDLLRTLSPHVILISVARSHLDEITFPTESEWSPLFTVKRTNPYRVFARRLRIAPEHSSFMVFGQAAQKPFATISSKDKVLVGTAVLEALGG